MRNSSLPMKELKGVGASSTRWFFLLSTFYLFLLTTNCYADLHSAQEQARLPQWVVACVCEKTKSPKMIFILIPSCYLYEDHPLKYCLKPQYSCLFLAFFPAMYHIETGWFHQFLWLDMSMILLWISLTEMWIFNFKLDTTSLFQVFI